MPCRHMPLLADSHAIDLLAANLSEPPLTARAAALTRHPQLSLSLSLSHRGAPKLLE